MHAKPAAGARPRFRYSAQSRIVLIHAMFQCYCGRWNRGRSLAVVAEQADRRADPGAVHRGGRGRRPTVRLIIASRQTSKSGSEVVNQSTAQRRRNGILKKTHFLFVLILNIFNQF